MCDIRYDQYAIIIILTIRIYELKGREVRRTFNEKVELLMLILLMHSMQIKEYAYRTFGVSLTLNNFILEN